MLLRELTGGADRSVFCKLLQEYKEAFPGNDEMYASALTRLGVRAQSLPLGTFSTVDCSITRKNKSHYSTL